MRCGPVVRVRLAVWKHFPLAPIMFRKTTFLCLPNIGIDGGPEVAIRWWLSPLALGLDWSTTAINKLLFFGAMNETSIAKAISLMVWWDFNIVRIIRIG